MYKLIHLRRRRINSVPLGPKLHTTTSTPLVSNYQNLSSSKMVPHRGTFFFYPAPINSITKKLFQNIFIHCLNKCPIPLGTSEGINFIPSGDELIFAAGVPFGLSHWLLVKGLNSSPVGTNYFLPQGYLLTLPTGYWCRV